MFCVGNKQFWLAVQFYFYLYYLIMCTKQWLWHWFVSHIFPPHEILQIKTDLENVNFLLKKKKDGETQM